MVSPREPNVATRSTVNGNPDRTVTATNRILPIRVLPLHTVTQSFGRSRWLSHPAWLAPLDLSFINGPGLELHFTPAPYPRQRQRGVT
jgi:hypothetical protein